MGTPNRQIGEGPSVQLLRQISKQLDHLIKVTGQIGQPTTTTTTTL